MTNELTPKDADYNIYNPTMPEDYIYAIGRIVANELNADKELSEKIHNHLMNLVAAVKKDCKEEILGRMKMW